MCVCVLPCRFLLLIFHECDPPPKCSKYPEPDYWVSMDPITTRNPIGDDGPEAGVTVHHYMNTGGWEWV